MKLRWWQIPIGIIGVLAVADGVYQMIQGVRELTPAGAPPLPVCDSQEAEGLVRKMWPAAALPLTRIIHPHEITAERDLRTCAAAFLQDDQKIHDGTFVFKRSPDDANKLSIDVKIAPPDQLAIGSLVFTQQKIKNWTRWNKIAQTDFGKVAFIGKQGDNGRGFNLIEYPVDLTTAPQSVSVDIQVQDMPRLPNMVNGAGLFIGKPPKDSGGKYQDFWAFTITSDGVISLLAWDDAAGSFSIRSQTEFSLVTSGTNTLSLTQEPDHHVRVHINGYNESSRSPVDLSDAVGVFLTTRGDGNRIELSNFQLDKPVEERELPVGVTNWRKIDPDQ